MVFLIAGIPEGQGSLAAETLDGSDASHPNPEQVIDFGGEGDGGGQDRDTTNVLQNAQE